MNNVSRKDYIYYIATAALSLMAFAPPASRFPGFSLEDQYERRWKHNDFQSPLVVYVISDRSGYSYSSNWTTPLVAEYRNRIRFVPIADVRGVPGFLKGYIRKRFKDEFKYPILMDWEGIITTGIKFTPGYPNLVIVDANRTIRHLTSGEGTASQLQSFRKQLNTLLNDKPN